MSKFKTGDNITALLSNRAFGTVMAVFGVYYVIHWKAYADPTIHLQADIDRCSTLKLPEISIGNSYYFKLNTVNNEVAARVIGICKDNDINYIVFVQHCTKNVYVRSETEFRRTYEV